MCCKPQNTLLVFALNNPSSFKTIFLKRKNVFRIYVQFASVDVLRYFSVGTQFLPGSVSSGSNGFNISCSSGLLVNSSAFLSSFLKDVFMEYRILGWYIFFFFQHLKVVLYCAPVCAVSGQKTTVTSSLAMCLSVSSGFTYHVPLWSCLYISSFSICWASWIFGLVIFLKCGNFQV